MKHPSKRLILLINRLKRLSEINPGDKKDKWFKLTMICVHQINDEVKRLEQPEFPMGGFINHIKKTIAEPVSSLDQNQNYSSFGDDEQSILSGSRVFGIPPDTKVIPYKVYDDNGKLSMNALAKSIEHSLASIKEEE